MFLNTLIYKNISSETLQMMLLHTWYISIDRQIRIADEIDHQKQTIQI